MSRGKKPTYLEYMDMVLAHRNFAVLQDTGDILCYDSGVYKDGRQDLDSVINVLLQQHEDTSQYKRDQIVGVIRDHVKRDRWIFDSNSFMLNTRNGLLEMQTGRLYPHTPSFLSRIQIDTDYDPGAQCDIFEETFRQVLPDKKDRDIIMDSFAACLIPRIAGPGMITGLFGPGLGKSTLLKIFFSVLGWGNVSILAQSTDTGEMPAADLDGKLAKRILVGSGREVRRLSKIHNMLCDSYGVGKNARTGPGARGFVEGTGLCGVKEERINEIMRIVWFSQNIDPDYRLGDRLVTETEKSGVLNLMIERAIKMAGRMVGSSKSRDWDARVTSTEYV